MTQKKQIHVVCKSNNSDRVNLAYQYWSSVLHKTENTGLSDIVSESLSTSDKETIKSGECRWFYCPAYHFCPFTDYVATNILGRASKKKLDIKFEGLDINKPGNESNFKFKETVTDFVVRENE